MLRIFLTLCGAQVVRSIIVRDPPPVYKYSYHIADPLTGDTKSQQEIKHGDIVRGFYSVLDPDGTKRTVQYTADPTHGFKATVLQEPAIEYKFKLHEKSTVPLVPRAQFYIKPDKVTYTQPHYLNQYFVPASEVSSESSERPEFNRNYFFPANDIHL